MPPQVSAAENVSSEARKKDFEIKQIFLTLDFDPIERAVVLVATRPF